MFTGYSPTMPQTFPKTKKVNVQLRGIVLLLICVASITTGCNAQSKTPITVEPWYPATNENGNEVFAVFESRIPCDDCEKIKFALALYVDSKTQQPTTYQMARVYVGTGNDRTINTGTWTIIRGTSLDSQAVVYRLDENAPDEFQYFWAIGDNILFILDQGMNPRVGTAGYSYALNRIR